MEWSTKKIDQVCLPVERIGLRAKPGKKFLCVDSSSIDGSRKVICSNKEIGGSNRPDQALNEMREGDILVSTVRPIDNVVAMVPPDLDGQLAAGDLCVLRPNVEVVDSKYLFYFAISQQFVGALASEKYVSDRDIRQINLPLPCLSEQKGIVEILDEMNKLRIASIDSGNRYLRILLALFHDLFGEPAANPKGWPIMSLEEFTIDLPQYGINANTTSWTDGVRSFVRATDITEEGTLRNSGSISLDLENCAPYKLNPGDVLMVATGQNLGRTYMHQSQDGLFVFARQLVRLKINREQVLPWILFALTKTDYYKSCIEARNMPAGLQKLDVKNLLKIQFPIPPMSKQKSFVSMVENLSKIYRLQSTTKENIQRIYSTTLQSAFSGRLMAS